MSRDRIIEGIRAETERRYKATGQAPDMSAIEEAHPSLLAHYGTRQRVRVTARYADGEDFTRTGYVSRTTGWRPALLLMHRSNASGSWDVLGPEDEVVAVQVNGRYVAAEAAR